MGPPFGVEFNNVAIPQGLYDSARFVKANSRPADLMQYSRSDRFSFLSAVTERLYFVNVNNFVAEEKGELARRSQLVRQLFDAKSSASQVAEALASSKISWLIVDPRDSQAWATVAGRAAVFESRGYQVYKVD
jgi:ABC-type sugar transport system substrate-binding protein